MQQLNFQFLVNNAQYFQRKIYNAKLCAVVKNDAYGHGLVNCAKTLCPFVDCFAVGSVQEAQQIAFLQKDTLVLLPQIKIKDIEIALSCGAQLTVDSFETLKNVCTVATNLNVTPKIHVKIDSGMSRLGFTFEQLRQLCAKLQKSYVTVVGVYSHFWADTVTGCDAQLHYFEKCCRYLGKYLPPFEKHIANTCATLLSKKYHLDMVRIGLGLYGYGDANLIPVKTVTAQVVAVKQLPKWSIVGYGGNYIAKEQMVVAVVNVGYAQGFGRVLVGGKVGVNGVLCKVLAVCMATIIVDVTDATVEVGNEVKLLGKGVNLANNEVIVYELLCNLR